MNLYLLKIITFLVGMAFSGTKQEKYKNNSVAFSVDCIYVNNSVWKMWFFLFLLISALNGCNGEWTNGDDKPNSARQRAKKEAKNHLHKKPQINQKPGGIDNALEQLKGVPTNPAEPVNNKKVEPVKEPPPQVEQQVIVEKEELQLVAVSYICVDLNLPLVANFKDTIYTYCDGAWVAVNGTIFDGLIVPPLEIVRCVLEVGEGWCVADGGHKSATKVWQATPCIKNFYFPAFTLAGIRYDEVRGAVYKPALKVLSKNVALTGNVSVTLKGTSLGLVQLKFPDLPHTIIDMTVTYWFYLAMRKKNVLLHDANTVKYMGLEGDHTVLENVSRRLGIATSRGNRWRCEGEECALPFDWGMKENFSYKLEGVSRKDDHFEFDAELVHVPIRYYHTMYCRFSGPNDNFMLYNVSGHNAMCASKRLIAKRLGEEVYQSQQMTLLNRLYYDGLVKGSVLATLNVDVNYVNGFAKVGTDSLKLGFEGNSFHLVPVEEITPFHISFSKKLEKFLRKFDRHAIAVAIDNFYDAGHWLYYKLFEKVNEIQDVHSARYDACNLRHIKRQLRLRYFQGVKLHYEEDSLVYVVSCKVKREFAKVGKAPRLYAAYEKGCIASGELPEFMKMGFLGDLHYPIQVNGCLVNCYIRVMSKPKPNSLKEIFDELIKSVITPNSVFIAIYSDDSVYAGNIADECFGYNVDISSCDSSNGELVFSVVGSVLSGFNEDRALALLKQCQCPIRLTNPNNATEVLTLRFHSAFEGSGSVLTTVLNHTASVMIAIAFIEALSDGYEKCHPFIVMDRKNISTVIIEGAYRVGHLVTTEPWVYDGTAIFEKMQFLKRSPIQTVDGAWVPCINYGCIFRSFGSVEGDMTAKQLGIDTATFDKMPDADRMENFLSSVVKGLCNEPSSAVMNALRSRFNADVQAKDLSTVLDFISEFEPCNYSAQTLSEASLCRRYDLNLQDITNLCTDISLIALGDDSNTQAVGKFYEVDYGVKATDL